MQFCIDIGPGEWVDLATPTNMSVGRQQPSIRKVPATGTYQMKGEFIVNFGFSVNDSTFDGELPAGFVPSYRQYRSASTDAVQPNTGNNLSFEVDGSITLHQSYSSQRTMSFDGIILLGE